MTKKHSGPARTWFTCAACSWHDIRASTTKICPRCRRRSLVRGDIATQEECDKAFNDLLKRLAEIPE